MAENIKFKFQTCTHCSQQKTLPTQTAYLGNTQSSKTLAQIHIDFLSLELDEKKKNLGTYYGDLKLQSVYISQ